MVGRTTSNTLLSCRVGKPPGGHLQERAADSSVEAQLRTSYQPPSGRRSTRRHHRPTRARFSETDPDKPTDQLAGPRNPEQFDRIGTVRPGRLPGHTGRAATHRPRSVVPLEPTRPGLVDSTGNHGKEWSGRAGSPNRHLLRHGRSTAAWRSSPVRDGFVRPTGP